MIGVFDSGIGGLTVVKALREQLPHHDIVYLGDTARTPYGSKSAATITRYSLNNTDFLQRQGARLIVIACNTASSYAFAAVRDHFDGPVFEVIGPGARLAMQRSRRFRIGVIGTRATVASGVYEQTIKVLQPGARVYATACPLLVPLVEEGWVRKPETAMIVRKYLHPLKMKQIDTLILGCTHYPVLRQVIQRKIGARVALVDSAEAVAGQVCACLGADGAMGHMGEGRGVLKIFVTDTAEQFRKTAQLILHQPVDIDQADL
ncbi:MAG: glutamate racemase [Desulfatitalea sp.]|nr:glutamate racemase [Desulfatitalea sp.]